MCNPIKTFECSIDRENIVINHFITPDADRTNIESELMPINILKENEINILKKEISSFNEKNIKFINESMRNFLPLRDTDKKIKIIGNKTHKKLK